VTAVELRDEPLIGSRDLDRNVNALVLGVALTTGLGFCYWLVAARLYESDDVGRVSALISAMSFLATVASLGLTNGLVRFLPSTAAPGRLIRSGYVATMTVAAIAAVGFVVGQPLWADDLDLVRTNVLAVVFFVAATAGWGLFALQDSVLTGLQRARWVPVENGIFAASKLVLLVLLTPFAAWGIVVSWVVPAVVLLIPVNWLVVRRVLPGRRSRGGTFRPLQLREVAAFAANDYAASLLWMATTQLMPLIVLARLSPEASAAYYLAFSICYAIFLTTISIGSAFVAEASLTPERAPTLLRRAAVRAGLLVVPAVAIGVAGAPLALRVFGSDYADQGAALLRLLIAAALPQAVIGLMLAEARHHGDTRLVMRVYAVTAVGVLGTTALTIDRFGLAGAGWAWLLTELAVAGTLVWRRRSTLRRHIGVLDRPIAETMAAGYRQLRSWPDRRRTRSVIDDIQRRFPVTVADQRRPPLRLLSTDNSTLVVDTGSAVARIAVDEDAVAGVRANATALRALARDPRLRGVRHIVPRLLVADADVGVTAALESRLVGVRVDRLAAGPRAAAVRRLAMALDDVNSATRSELRFGPQRIAQLVSRPMSRVTAVPWLAPIAADLAAIEGWLVEQLAGRDLVVGRVHGDPWLGNVLAYDADDPAITGIIDWENSRAQGLLDIDLFLLAFSALPRQLGDSVLRAHRNPVRADRMVRSVCDVMRPNPSVSADVVAVLAWLHHIDGQLARNPHARHHRVWLTRNVIAVANGVAAELDRTARPQRQRTEAIAGPRRRRPHHVTAAMIGGSVALWVAASWRLDVSAMDDHGLISVLNIGHLAALVLLAGSFVRSLHRRSSELVLATHVVVLAAFWHMTPAVVYDNLRYAWAWKHTGIVEYLMREGRLDTTVPISSIYHSWPGFFAGSALLTELVGLGSVRAIATWMPLLLNLLAIVSLRALLRCFTDDRRQIWLAVWLFLLANWVGQDYFAPQGVDFLLYLLVVLVVLRTAGSGSRLQHRRSAPAPLPPRAGVAIATVLVIAIATSHQITPVMMIIALLALTWRRDIRGAAAIAVTAVAIGATVAWALTVGRGYVFDITRSVLEDFGDPLASTSATFERSDQLSGPQRLVSLAGRGIVVLMAGLAVLGFARQRFRGTLDRALVTLAVCPAILIVATSFGGEVLFRTYLFAVPFLALGAATAILPDQLAVDHRRQAYATAAVTALLVPCFVLAFFGKDREYTFTDDEVAAATWLYEHAPPGSTIVEGSPNYPYQFLRYEQFTYVPISREPDVTRSAVVENPTFVLGEWLADDAVPAVFLILTTSQARDIDAFGPLPIGSIEGIETELRASPRFEVVYRNDDAVIFELAGRP
jgi:O-antigen/teichoic acid export membrane protein